MRIEVNGVTLAYDDAGQGEAALLIHAFPLNRRMWAAQVEALVAAGYRAITPDLRGFGESQAPPGPYPMTDLAGDLLALLDALGLERVVVVGLSMGGYIAFRLIQRAPERVRGLVLADTRAGQDAPAAAATRLERAAMAERHGVEPVVQAMLPGMVAGGDPTGADPALVEHIRSLMLTASPAGVAGALRGMAARPDATPELAGIACPTLVICGALDALTPPDEAYLMAEHIARARLVVLEHAGHLSNIEQPEAFNRALLTFLAELFGVDEDAPGA